MLLCAICPEPGHCCKNFHIVEGGGTFWKDSWRVDALAWARARSVPFEPHLIYATFTDPLGGREYVQVSFSCPKLTSEGRCSIYQDRPFACSNYRPLQDKLCIMTEIGWDKPLSTGSC